MACPGGPPTGDAPRVRRWPCGGETSTWLPLGWRYGVVKAKGADKQLVEGPTRTGQSRVVDVGPGSVAAVRAYRAARARMALDGPSGAERCGAARGLTEARSITGARAPRQQNPPR